MRFHVGHSTIGSISLDGPTLQRLLVQVPEDQFQVLAIAFHTAKCQNTNRELKYVELGDAGTGVAKRSCGSRVHSKGCDLDNGIPAG